MLISATDCAHRTTRGMLRAQAAEKSGYLKMDGFSAKA